MVEVTKMFYSDIECLCLIREREATSTILAYTDTDTVMIAVDDNLQPGGFLFLRI